jgi:negative regulator of sigma E activity
MAPASADRAAMRRELTAMLELDAVLESWAIPAAPSSTASFVSAAVSKNVGMTGNPDQLARLAQSLQDTFTPFELERIQADLGRHAQDQTATSVLWHVISEARALGEKESILDALH